MIEIYNEHKQNLSYSYLETA